MIMETGVIPPKNACFQCYQPPVFYYTSAIIGNIVTHLGGTSRQLYKILQFLNCFYDIAALVVIYLILRRVRLSEFSRLLAFGTACFLPRHVYMAAIHSNDAIASLAVAVCAYLLLVVIERRLSLLGLGMLSIAVTIAIFTKYTALVVIPMVLTTFAMVFLCRMVTPRRKVTIALALVLVLPLSLLGGYLYSNLRHYNAPLPWNDTILDTRALQPRDQGGVSFTSFKPWQYMKAPILMPGQLNSFWTLMYSGMWFDTEPKFLFYTDPHDSWWKHYYAWLRGQETFPEEAGALSRFTRFSGTALITLGLVPLFFVLIGGCFALVGNQHVGTAAGCVEVTKLQMFLVLFLCNAAGLVLLTMRAPVFSSMKSTYFLSSLPAFAISLARGLMSCEKPPVIRGILGGVFGVLFVLAVLHVFQIGWSRKFCVGI